MTNAVSEALETRRLLHEAEMERARADRSREREIAAAEFEMRSSGIGRSNQWTKEEWDARSTAAIEREWRSYLETGVAGDLLIRGDPLSETEQRDLGLTGAAGGFLVPARMADALVRAEIFNSSMLANVTVLHTEDGRPISRPSIADQATLAAIPGENTTVGASVDFTVTNNSVLNAFQYAARVKASWQMDQDARPGANGGFDLSDALADVIGARIGSVLQRDLTVGVGTTAPSGLFDPTVGAAVGFTMATGSTTTFASGVLGFAAMRALRDFVNAVYWPTAAWMMNTATASLVQGLLDTNGHPFFRPDQACTPLGFPILINDSVPALSANALVMSFGSLSRGYTARLTPQSVTVLRERFADLAQTGYVGHVKCDGKVSGDLGAVKLLKMAAS